MSGLPDRADPVAAARSAVEAALAAGAHEAEAVLVTGESALTRFAGNRIHQNVASSDLELSVRAVIGRSVGVASTNSLSDEAVRAACAAAVEAASHAPEDPGFPGLPTPAPVETPDRTMAATMAFGPVERAAAAGAIIAPSASRGSNAAGTVAMSLSTTAIANSKGIGVAQSVSGARATVLSDGRDGGSGWASFSSRDASALDPAALGERAAAIAMEAAGAGALDPGVYPVVLSPEAMADMLQFLGWFGFGARAFEEGRSFLSGRLGEPVMAPAVTIVDDATATDALGLTFDYEGCPKHRVPLVDAGVATGVVTDSYFSARMARPNTGHALPAPNSYGPLPLDLRMSGGGETRESLIASVDRGVYVTRFHYVNIEEPSRAVLTGMTRDGTFLIEAGEITRPLRNLRFTQSAVDAMASVAGLSTHRERAGEEQGALAPWALIERFAFTGQTS